MQDYPAQAQWVGIGPQTDHAHLEKILPPAMVRAAAQELELSLHYAHF
jgi:hypothetical protein